jgi:hypothetical protein
VFIPAVAELFLTDIKLSRMVIQRKSRLRPIARVLEKVAGKKRMNPRSNFIIKYFKTCRI